MTLLAFSADGLTESSFAAPRPPRHPRRRFSPPVVAALVVRAGAAQARLGRHGARTAIRKRRRLRLVDTRLRRRAVPQHHADQPRAESANPVIQSLRR